MRTANTRINTVKLVIRILIYFAPERSEKNNPAFHGIQFKGKVVFKVCAERLQFYATISDRNFSFRLAPPVAQPAQNILPKCLILGE